LPEIQFQALRSLSVEDVLLAFGEDVLDEAGAPSSIAATLPGR